MSMKLSGKALVIQLTRDHIRIAKMTLGTKAQILNNITLDTPAGAVDDGEVLDIEALQSVIAPALATPEFKGTKRVVFALMTTQTMSERITVPAVTGQRLDKLLEVNMDIYFPVDISDHQITRQEIGHGTDENGDKTLILQMWAVPKGILRNYYKLASACGLSVAAIDYCGNSIVNVAGASFAQPTPKKQTIHSNNKSANDQAVEALAIESLQVYLLAEADQFIMTFVEGGQVVMQRSFPCVSDIDTALSEAMMVLDYYRSTAIEADLPMEVTVCGSLAEEEEFENQASIALNLPVQSMPGEYTPAWYICVGAACTNLDFGSPELAGKKAKKTESLSLIWHFIVLLVGAVALILICAIFLTAKTNWNSEISSLQNTEQILRLQAAQNQKNASLYSDYTSQYQRFSGDWDTIFSSLRTYNDNLVLILEELEQLLPSESKVTAIDIQSAGMSVQFSCTNKEETAYLIMALREMKYANLSYISNISGTTGTVGRVEAPPTEGSSDFSAMVQKAIASGQLTQAEISAIFSNLTPEQQMKVLSGNLSEQEAMQIVMSLPADQQQKLMNLYLQNGGTGTGNGNITNTTTYDVNDLTNRATLDQRSEAIDTMLTEDLTVTYRFFELLQEDIGREPRTTIVYETVSDDMWNNPNLMSAFLSGDPMEIYAALPDLIGVLTKNERSVAGTERLCIEGGLGDTYAKYLARAMGLEQQNNDNTGGNGGGFDIDSLFPSGGNTQTPEEQDNRIHFAVNLDYNESLIQAELERRGFSFDEKPAMLEVEG